MKSISDIVLNFFELFEAEGRMLREKTITAGTALISIFTGALFLFVACISIAGAAYIYISSMYDEMIALSVIGIAFALVGVTLIMAGRVKR